MFSEAIAASAGVSQSTFGELPLCFAAEVCRPFTAVIHTVPNFGKGTPTYFSRRAESYLAEPRFDMGGIGVAALLVLDSVSAWGLSRTCSSRAGTRTAWPGCPPPGATCPSRKTRTCLCASFARLCGRVSLSLSLSCGCSLLASLSCACTALAPHRRACARSTSLARARVGARAPPPASTRARAAVAEEAAAAGGAGTRQPIPVCARARARRRLHRRHGAR